MKKYLYIFAAIFLNSTTSLFGQNGDLTISELPPIPDQEGFAGMFTGVSGGALLCMGGANFPNGRPWEDGQKVWYDYIYVLESENGEWNEAEQKLPYPLGYGVSVTYKDEVLLIGGSNADGHYSGVVGVKYKNGKIVIDYNYPDLPVSLAMMSGALVGETIYIAGGLETPTGSPTNHFFALDLSLDPGNRQWEELESWPGSARLLSVAASKDEKFYLFSGIYSFKNPEGQPDRTLLRDAYVFDPGKERWTALPTLPRAVAAAPNPAPVLGLNHILFPGGLDSATAVYPDPETHPGFLDDVLAYNTLSKTYGSVGTLPEGASRVTLPSTQWKGVWVIPNGESGPGVRSPKVYTISN